MIDPLSAISVASSGITIITSPDYLLDGLTAGYVLLTLALAIIAFRSLSKTQASLDLTRQQIALNKQQSQEATAASERHSQATIAAVHKQIEASEAQSRAAIETVHKQIAASEKQALEALYSQHKPVIVPISTSIGIERESRILRLQNKGTGVALNTSGTLTIVGDPTIRYCFQTHFLVPDNEEQISFRNEDILLTHAIFEDYPLFPPNSDNGIAPLARLMITYNDAFANKYLIVFDKSEGLGWRQVNEIKRVNQRLDELAVGKGWFNE